MSDRQSRSLHAREEDAEWAEDGLAGLTTDWSVPWSDLMMVMFVVFLVLFVGGRAPSVADAILPDTGPDHVAPVAGPTRGVYEASRELVQSTRLDDVDVVLQDDASVKVSVRGSTYFDLGRVELREETRRFLDGLAGVLGRHISDVRVVGHTDSFPITSTAYPTNWELSSARASQVARYLIERGRLDPGRFEVVGRSMYRPAVPNSNEANKSLNRRVEIFILPPTFDVRVDG